MDALSDVLRLVRLGGAVFLNGEFTAPWCVSSQADAGICASFLPVSERVVSYHLIAEGNCWAQLADDPASAIYLSAGELLVVPQGEAHIIGSALDLPAVPSAPLLAKELEATPGKVMKIAYGEGGALTRLVCGFLACDDTLSNPILSALPRLFKIDMRGDSRSAWLESSLQFAAGARQIIRIIISRSRASLCRCVAGRRKRLAGRCARSFCRTCIVAITRTARTRVDRR